MFELEKSENVKKLIQITKSDSGISGPELVKSHIRLGELLGRNIDLEPSNTTIIAIMRGGIFFAQGIYMTLGCRFKTYDPKYEHFKRPETQNILLVDSVINTGKTIREIISPDMKIACCVINDSIVTEFSEQLYTVRVSKNSFVGSDIKTQLGNVGPDTTLRLFNLI